MRCCAWLLVLAIGCRKDEDQNPTEKAAEAPDSCVVDDQVCAAFSADWSQEEADALCADLGGTVGECAEDELGRCLFEDGMEYVLYEMPPRDAESYCAYLSGVWLEPGEEPEDE